MKTLLLPLALVCFAIASLAQSSIQSFVLVNADNNSDLFVLQNGQTINLADLPTTQLNIRVNTNPDKVSYVAFTMNGADAGTDKATPYAIFGDRRGRYDPWTPNPGTYSFTATPYETAKGKTVAGTSGSISVSFVNTPAGTAPAAPSQLQVIATVQGSAAISWVDNANNEDQFNLQYASILSPSPNWTNLASLPANTTSYQDGSLSNNAARYYRIAAVNSYGSSAWSNTVQIFNLPQTPTGLAAGNISAGTVDLSWTATAYADSYEISYAPQSTGVYQSIPLVNFGSSNTTVTGLSTQTTYLFRIRSLYASNVSAWSDPIQATTLDAVQEVQNLVLINADNDSDIRFMKEKDTINLFYLPTINLNMRAETNPAVVGSIGFNYDGNANFRTENVAPYALNGDNNGDYNAWTPTLGLHNLIVTPYSGTGKTGTVGTNKSIQFLVIDEDTSTSNPTPPPVLSGELKKWHKVTISFTGPATSESDAVNPFMNYRLDVTFTNGNKSYIVPGYYAADGNAAETGATSGNKWLVHFNPDETGVWNYTASFRQGANVAIASDPLSGTATSFNGQSGSFTITASDKTGRDFRAAGRLQYVGEHFLRFAETGKYFIKAGADAPENTLAYEDFDAVSNRKNLRKSWSFHQQDYSAADAGAYTWQSGKGSELLGAVNYLSGQGMNAFSFLTFSFAGDDQNVFPHLMKISVPEYEALPAIGGTDPQSMRVQYWNDVLYHDRFDVSKMAQWEKIFEYADKKGMYLHFKTMETENDNLMDNNFMGPERKIYYRELIARFGHHLGLNWNISEEESLSTQTIQQIADYIAAVDPYHSNIVIHTFPNGYAQYAELTGSQSQLTGASMQIDINSVHSVIGQWVSNSAASGKKWIVANDEQGGANAGVTVDAAYPDAQLPENRGMSDNRDAVRNKVLWGTLLAGGAGVEYYYGYQTGSSDLTCQDHRTRATKWQDAKKALDFFDNYLQPYLISMQSKDAITSSGTDFVFGNDDVYVIYLPAGGSTDIDLTTTIDNFEVRWYDPRNGGALQQGSVSNIAGGTVSSIGTAPNNTSLDWVVFLQRTTSVRAAVSKQAKNLLGKSEIIIYPNPANQTLHVQWPSTETQATIRLMDAQGKVLQTHLLSNGNDQIPVDNLSNGVYWVECVTSYQKRLKKIVILH